MNIRQRARQLQRICPWLTMRECLTTAIEDVALIGEWETA